MNTKNIERAIARLGELKTTIKSLNQREWIPARFNMNVFADTEWWSGEGRVRECGFAGCLVGWAAVQRWYADGPVRLDLDGNNEPVFSGILDAYDMLGGVAALFGVSQRAARCVVFPGSYDVDGAVTIEHVQERLRALLRMSDDEFVQTYYLGG